MFGDAGYQGPRAAQAAASAGRSVFEIVKRNELHKFIVLPKRWIVERTLAWISRNRRLARDFRALRPHRRCLRQAGDDPHHAPTPDPSNSFNLNHNLPDRL